MSGVGILGAIIIGILAGWLAEKIMKRNHGLLTNLVVGLVGALLGAFVAGLLGINFGGWIGSIVVSTIGAVVLLFLLGLVKRRA
ncbi:GlsB/YeaQ/YmgE family stress response membrane protein [Phenylobacterium sp.]|uniref:GlsB/YeaQ/YmgE family stress response membrane protein n=1 Tax=Phenylobacterium sp. TaxID=1871053 RepID=UPI0027329E0E|nr:GlsB/YeaQ/YmgE family stress response membrane protein [Phenylobacterium sp.]MDP3660315.1 GlsB/YeaQ/YmgE family stress response membrane protein [Phenylobacterium sp.]